MALRCQQETIISKDGKLMRHPDQCVRIVDPYISEGPVGTNVDELQMMWRELGWKHGPVVQAGRRKSHDGGRGWPLGKALDLWRSASRSCRSLRGEINGLHRDALRRTDPFTSPRWASRRGISRRSSQGRYREFAPRRGCNWLKIQSHRDRPVSSKRSTGLPRLQLRNAGRDPARTVRGLHSAVHDENHVRR